MTDTKTNEAAERLRESFPAGGGYAGGNDNIRTLLDKALADERQAGRQEAVEAFHYFGHEYSVGGRQEWHAYDCLYRKTWSMGGNDEPGCAAVRAILAETEGQQG